MVGPSLGAAVAIDFAVSHPEAVSALSFFYLRIMQCRFIWKEITTDASDRIVSICSVP